MTYQDMITAARRFKNLESTLNDIYECIIKGEEKYLKTLSEHEQGEFKTAANEYYKFDTGRSWGSSWFRYTEDIEFGDTGATLKFEQEDYCRSCYMGQIYDRIFIPENLINAKEQEDDYSGEVFEQALGQFIQERAQNVIDHIAAKKAEAEKKRQAAEKRKETIQKRKEAEELQLFKKLSEKYGDNLQDEQQIKEVK